MTRKKKQSFSVTNPHIILSRGCRCGKLMRVCPHCGNWYCPKCDEYHLENCIDQKKGGE